MKIMKAVVVILSSVLLMGCIAHQEGVIQKADVSYITFTGNIKNAIVQLDNDKPFQMMEESQGKRLYQLRPGRHVIKVFRGNVLIVNRILFLDNQTTTEVMIP